MTASQNPSPHLLPKAGVLDSLAFAAHLALPVLAKGVIIRRPGVVGMAERLRLDDRGVDHMMKLRRKYGPGPLLLSVPMRSMAVILDPAHVSRVLDNAPEPFAPAAREKQAALAHFEPRVALASHGQERQVRREFNERALDPDEPVHPMARQFLGVVEEEAAQLLQQATASGELSWAAFTIAWHRMVRRVVLGDGAREDHELTDMLAELRRRGNWAFLRRKDKRLRDAYHQRLDGHLQRAEPNSLAALIGRLPKTADTAPTHQVSQWLFAFDPAGMATARALALLTAHPEQMERAREETGSGRVDERPHLEFLRACILESLRLWATTPAVLRETTAPVTWERGEMPEQTMIAIFAPYFHRDEDHLNYAHQFRPDIWLDGASDDWPLIPFSRGPAVCPAKNLVPMLGSAMLAAIIRDHELTLKTPLGLDRRERLPGTLDNYSLRFAVRSRGAQPRAAP